MSDFRDTGEAARAAVFGGLRPTVHDVHPPLAETYPAAGRSAFGRGVMMTMPIVLAGAMTVANLTGPLDPASAAPRRPATPGSDLATMLKHIREKSAAPAAATAAPTATTYTVVVGDTVSRIAARFGVSTASVLNLNGLGMTSLIFPGQKLVVRSGGSAATPPPAASGRYTIARGDTISEIASRYGVSTASVLAANGLGWTSIIYPGQTLTIPGGATNGLDIETVSSVTPTNPDDESGDPASTPVVSTPAPIINDRYTITRGDTISSIASRFGVSVQAILDANGLALTSIIYSGRSLVIPGVVALQDGTTITPLTAEMAANARIVIAIGHELGVSDRGIVVALAAAMQESSLRNVAYGDRDSVGLFQQRPSTGWGSKSQLLDVAHAARLFFGGEHNPNRGNTRGLLDIAGWESLTVTQAAQKVQISAYPTAYAKWEKSAWAWLTQLS